MDIFINCLATNTETCIQTSCRKLKINCSVFRCKPVIRFSLNKHIDKFPITHELCMTGYGHTELFKVTCYNFQPSRAC